MYQWLSMYTYIYIYMSRFPFFHFGLHHHNLLKFVPWNLAVQFAKCGALKAEGGGCRLHLVERPMLATLPTLVTERWWPAMTAVMMSPAGPKLETENSATTRRWSCTIDIKVTLNTYMHLYWSMRWYTRFFPFRNCQHLTFLPSCLWQDRSCKSWQVGLLELWSDTCYAALNIDRTLREAMPVTLEAMAMQWMRPVLWDKRWPRRSGTHGIRWSSDGSS